MEIVSAEYKFINFELEFKLSNADQSIMQTTMGGLRMDIAYDFVECCIRFKCNG